MGGKGKGTGREVDGGWDKKVKVGIREDRKIALCRVPKVLVAGTSPFEGGSVSFSVADLK